MLAAWTIRQRLQASANQSLFSALSSMIYHVVAATWPIRRGFSQKMLNGVVTVAVKG
jgi:hypothetical protein